MKDFLFPTKEYQEWINEMIDESFRIANDIVKTEDPEDNVTFEAGDLMSQISSSFMYAIRYAESNPFKGKKFESLKQ